MTTRRSTSKNIALVFGSLATLTGVGLGVGGGARVWAHNTQRDAAGFYATSAERIETPTFALTSEQVDLGVDNADYRWVPGDGANAVRLVATANGGRPVFVRIAPSADVEAYLANAAHAEVTDFDVDPFRTEMRQLGGPVLPVLRPTRISGPHPRKAREPRP